MRAVLMGTDVPDPDGRLTRSAGNVPLWIVAVARDPRTGALAEGGAEVVKVVAGPDGRPDIAETLGALAGHKIAEFLVEGSGRLAAALFRAGLADRIAWYRADAVLGGDGVPAVGALKLARLEDGRGWRRVESRDFGEESFRLSHKGGCGSGHRENPVFKAKIEESRRSDRCLAPLVEGMPHSARDDQILREMLTPVLYYPDQSG